MITLFLSFVMMAGLFLMLWGAVGFVQNKRFFTSAPKAVQDAVLNCPVLSGSDSGCTSEPPIS